jgi:putative ABC transport system ATP-binding protein
MSKTALQVSNLVKRFGLGAAEVTAVHDVSLAVEAGEIVLIMGPSGSGKSTLLLMLGALLKPSEGSVQLNGEIISQLAESRLSDIRLRHFGFVFQDFNLLSSLTVLENVAFVAELAGLSQPEARQKSAQLLSDLGLGERLAYDPAKLSGGEKQRVAIARALINEPVLILADEPTANLDSKSGREVMRLFRRLVKEQNRSAIIVSHDQRIKEIADRVLWLEDGEFKEAVLMSLDPVCGMNVEKEQAISAVWEGQEYFFCAQGCRDEFLHKPQAFLEKNT